MIWAQRVKEGEQGEKKEEEKEEEEEEEDTQELEIGHRPLRGRGAQREKPARTVARVNRLKWNVLIVLARLLARFNRINIWFLTPSGEGSRAGPGAGYRRVCVWVVAATTDDPVTG